MTAVAVTVRQAPAAAVIAALVGALAIAVLTDVRPDVVAPLALIAVVLTSFHRALTRWTSLLVLLILIVMLIPIKRYELPGALPFDFEPYRLVVALMLVCWATSLLIDPQVRLRRTPFDGPLVLFVSAATVSIVANPGRVQPLSSYVGKSLMFFLAFVLMYFFVASVVRDRHSLNVLIRTLVLVGAAVAAFAVSERRTGYNVFDHLQTVFPPLQFEGASAIERAGRLRVFGSAQHPIALGAMFAMLIPLGIYLAQVTVRRRWWLIVAILALGVLATASRTAILMLVVATLVFLWLKPVETRRVWPVVVPALVVVHLVLPGAIGTIRHAFFPPGGIVAEQTNLAPGSDPQLAGGRVRQLVPSIKEASATPLFGQGYGTRITGFDNVFRNAPILDNQWLATLLEMGAVGFGALVWLFVRATRRLGRASRAGAAGDDWLFAALAASISAFGIGLLTYDAFSFIQVAFVFWIILALAAVALTTSPNLGDS